ncbi:uncharacterized protein LOC134684770 [Mytilus trossulus]|uniref:uncharacterized protein LOC134684770 n=1 Tax=Mytilus trossulus TaxID=6551 RepID=UPI00300542C0
MASSTGKLCGPCEARYNTTTAVSWCMDCDDGLCSECIEDHRVNKASKKHHTIPVSQYIEIESVSSLIKQECEEHDQRLTFYCLDHCVTACALCVPEKHKQCTSLKTIEELARNAKTSTELFEIEKGIKELDNVFDKLENNRQQNNDTIKDQRKTISTEIKFLRKQINKHLDNIEYDLLTELESKSDLNLSEINMFLAKLKDKGKEIKSLGKTIFLMKETLSDVQVFLATNSIIAKLREEQEWVSMHCNQDSAKESVLDLYINPQLKNLLSDLKHFGAIQVVRNPCQVKVGNCEEQRAQLIVPTIAGRRRNIEKTKLELVRTILFKGGFRIKDCVLVNDGRMIFANSNKNKVLVYTHDEQLSKTISVGKYPFGLAVISTESVAVTCFTDKSINIINIDEGVVKKNINVGKPCSGLSYQNGKLYVLATLTGIMEFDVAGSLIRTIGIDVPDGECYLSVHEDKFCYSSYDGSIACFDSNGREIWRSDVADSGVAVDNYGNYFASDYEKCTLQMISADGKRTKQILDFPAGNHIEGVAFDKKSSLLLVICGYRSARLYRVI